LLPVFSQHPGVKAGVFFYPPPEALSAGLPVVTGLETKVFGPRPGKAYNISELVLVLHILKEIGKNSLLKDCKLIRIDVSDIANSSIFLPCPNPSPGPCELEVKLGRDKIKDKVNIMAGLLIDAKNDSSSIKYIDLRFKDPVIKFKDAK